MAEYPRTCSFTLSGYCGSTEEILSEAMLAEVKQIVATTKDPSQAEWDAPGVILESTLGRRAGNPRSG